MLLTLWPCECKSFAWAASESLTVSLCELDVAVVLAVSDWPEVFAAGMVPVLWIVPDRLLELKSEIDAITKSSIGRSIPVFRRSLWSA